MSSRTQTALVSIIIPCWNAKAHTARCLRRVARWTQFPHEIIAVNNNSSDGTAGLLRRFGGLRVIHNRENRGFARAINQGAAVARGRRCSTGPR
jgi:GT2 family glycosyltransferase